MRKLLSVILAAVMTVSVFALSVVPAMAADTVNSPTATTAQRKGVTLRVNGRNSRNISYRTVVSEDGSEVVTFTYTAEGKVIGWEQNLKELGLVEGTDFTAVHNADGTYTISFISEKAIAALDSGDVVVNAVVEEASTSTTSAATTKKNDSSKAPDTGIASTAVAGSLAVAFAGAAVLAATKKRDAE